MTVVMPLKSPRCMALVGSVRNVGDVRRRISFHSSPPKKNSLSRIAAPPKVHPKLL